MRTVEEKQLNKPPSGWWNAPNAISLTRICLAPPVAYAIWANHEYYALMLLALAAVTDFLDGFLARTRHVTTPFGVYLDPIADKILLTVVYAALGFTARVPLWFVGIVFGRDLALIVASAIAMKFSSYNNYRPTIWGKLSTFWQIVAAISAIPAPESSWTHAAVSISATATVWSAIHYTYRGISFFVRR
jgi:cardiolipin synthase